MKATLTLVTVLVCSSFAGARFELTGAELCKRLTGEQMSSVIGSSRTAVATDSVCAYKASGRPEIRLLNSTSDTAAEFTDLVKTLKGKTQPGPAGSLLSAVGFDLQNGKISAAWFQIGKSPVEIEFDAGIEAEKAAKLVELTRKN